MCSPLSLPSGVKPLLDLPICKVESNSCKQRVESVYYEECIGLLPCSVQDYATKEDLLYQKLQVPLVEAFVKTLKDPQNVEASEAGPATNSFFLFRFCENSSICLEGKSMTPHWGNTILFRPSQQLPRLRLRPLKVF